MPFAIPIAILTCACALAAANIWLGPGIVNTRGGGDSPFLFIRVDELTSNLRAGVFPARWMPDAAFGLGYPFFNFYAALPYYLASALSLVGFDLLTAIKLTQTIGMFAAAGAMFLFARTMLSRSGSTLAAAAYVLTPFHLANVYVRGDSLSEFFAFVWYPLILWAVNRVTLRHALRQDKLDAGRRTFGFHFSSCVTLALCLAALVLTHNVSALIFAPFAIVYALALLIHHSIHPPSFLRAFLRGFVSLAIAAIFALTLSAWFWLPSLAEAPSAQLTEQATGYFNYSNHFRAANLIQPSLVFDYTVTADLGVFAMGLLQAILTAVGTLVWLTSNLRARRSNFNLALMTGLFLLSTLMMTPLSQFIWGRAPLLLLAQFPWRFLSVQAVFASALIGGIGHLEIGDWRLGIGGVTLHLQPFDTLRVGVSSLIAGLCALLLLVSALLQLPNERLNIRPEDVTTKNIQLYEWYSGNIGTTIRAEYLPETAQPRPMTGPDLLGQPRHALVAQDGIAPDAISSRLESQSPARQVWRIRMNDDLSVTLPLLYSPAWHAEASNDAGSREVPLTPYAGSGWAMLGLPRGEYRLTLSWAGTALQRAAEVVSLLASAVLVVILVAAFARQSTPVRRRVVSAAVVGIGSVVALLGVSGVSRLLRNSATPPLIQTLDYAQRPFPHRDPVIFSASNSNDGMPYELIGAKIEPSQLRAGEPFSLTLTWRDDRTPAHITVTQELPMGGEFIAADSRKLFRFARLESSVDGSVSTHVLLSNTLPGPTLLKLTAADVAGRVLTPATPSGQKLMTEIAGKPLPAITLVGPTVIETPANAPTDKVADFGNGITLHSIDWFHPSSQEVCFRPQWSRDASKANQADALQVSMRLRGKDGRMIAQADSQPHGGLAPTWSWQDRVLVNDSQCVATADLLEPDEPYTLQIVWYRLSNLEQTGEVTLHGRRGPRLEDLNVPVL